MKVILDIKDEKAAFVLELLKNFSFVKTKPLSDTKAQLLEDLRDAIEEVKEAKKTGKKLKTLDQFLNEL